MIIIISEGLYIFQIVIFFPESSIMSTNNPSQVEYVVGNVGLKLNVRKYPAIHTNYSL